MRLTQSEENYIKAIYSIQTIADRPISTNELAEKMETKASSATDMIQRLSEKEIITYIKYK
jgi:DtxR family Mn-dependent transcriptional regulator